MRTKLLAGALVVVLLVAGGLWFWADAIFASDAVRTALERQLGRAVGQPVAIGGISASIVPRLTIDLADIRIGQPPRIQARSLHVGTNLRALVSRRIEGARLRLDGARIELPVAPIGPAPSGGDDTGSPVEIVSVDEIALTDLEVVSGGRTLHGDIAAELAGSRLTLTNATLNAGGAPIEVSGTITDMAGPTGELNIEAAVLDLDGLIAFASDFAQGAAAAGAESPPAAPGPTRAPAADQTPMNLTLTLNGARATFGTLALDGLTARARVTPNQVNLEPLAFGFFDGRYEGGLAATFDDGAPAFRWTAHLTNVSVAEAVAFAGTSDLMTGRLDATVDITGRGTDPAAALQSARGTVRVDITDGIVRRLGLVQNVVVATSGRSDVDAAAGSTDEPFSRLGATLALVNGTASTQDLRFESKNLLVRAAGALRLDGSAINLAGTIQLSEDLTAKAGRDLVRYTREDGRVTLPVTITGPAAAPIVRVDVSAAAERAIRNRVEEEAGKAIKKGLEGLIRR
jgi:uncharacterized protein involved in outer membrane biogenesis